MSEEDAFQAAIDAAEDDYTRNLARCVFADWLEERDDPRAVGYRCLAACNRNSVLTPFNGYECPFWYSREWVGSDSHSHVLPWDWFSAIQFNGKHRDYCPEWTKNNKATRRELDDAAALAVALLPPERVEMLLMGAMFAEVAA